MLPRLVRHLPLFVLLAACLGLGVSQTTGLTWPHDADLYRNIAQAQTMADGDWFADPNCGGEKSWCNPLTAAVNQGESHGMSKPSNLVERLLRWFNTPGPMER